MMTLHDFEIEISKLVFVGEVIFNQLFKIIALEAIAKEYLKSFTGKEIVAILFCLHKMWINFTESRAAMEITISLFLSDHYHVFA